MPPEASLSHTAAIILQAIHTRSVYGFSIMERTGLPSGTVYPALRRLERDSLILSEWEQPELADKQKRPPRRYYTVTPAGKDTLKTLTKRYPLLEKLVPDEAVTQA